MNNVEAFLDNLFTNAAKERELNHKGKQYSYKLFSGQWMDELKATGICEVIARRYDKGEDCDILTCKDLTTNETFCCNQFAIKLTEVERK